MTMAALGRTVANALFLFALSIWGGMVVFFTFVTTTTIFDTLDRDLAATVLGKLFPVYFQIQLLCAVIALAFVLDRLLHLGNPPRRAIISAAIMLGLAVAVGSYLLFILQPQMATAQAAVGSFVTTAKDAPARIAYGQMHGRAMMLNAITALLGGGVLLITACNPRLLMHAGEARRPAALPQQNPAPVESGPRGVSKQPPTY